MGRSLYPFQDEGVRALVANRRLYLADEMGLGKTIQAAVASSLIPGVRHVLVLCPAAAVGVWRNLFPRWSDKHLDVMSYDKWRGMPEGMEAVGWDLLVCDEAHYLKTRSAQRTKTVLRFAQKIPRVWFLSGTPMPNMNPQEMYPILRALWPDKLKELGARTYYVFSDLFTTSRPGAFGRVVTGIRNEEKWKMLLGEVMLRRTWQEVGLQLPPLRFEDVRLELSGSDFTEYLRKLAEAVDYDTLSRIEEALALGSVPVEGEVATIRRLHGTLKAPTAGAMLKEELADHAYDKLVVIAYHRDVIRSLETDLHPFGVVSVTGASSTKQRTEAERVFQEDPAIRVFIGQIQAAGVALTLTAAHEIVLVEQDWVPDNNTQAIKRIHRIGQEHPCRVRMLIAPKTIDESVAAVRRLKLSRAGAVYP